MPARNPAPAEKPPATPDTPDGAPRDIPPTPPAGGSYIHNPDTGDLTPVAPAE